MKRSAVIGIFAVCGLLCGCRDRFGTPVTDAEVPAPNVTLATLHSLYHGQTVVIREDLVIGGYVTSSDEAGNFYRTLALDDGTGGVELRIAEYNLYTIYAPGSYLTASLQGCALGERNGVLQIGLPPETYSPYPTDYIASRVLLDRMLHRTDERRDISPPTYSIPQLNRSLCGRLIRIDGLRFRSETEQINPQTWAGYRLFEDTQGNLAAVYTSEYARFSEMEISPDRCSLTGVLEYGTVSGYGKLFMLQMRDENDCSH